MGNLTEQENTFTFWRNLILIVFFFTITPIALSASMFSLWSLSKFNLKNENLSNVQEMVESPRSGVKVFASLPNEFPSISGLANSADARGEIIRQYLDSYNSPLTPYAGLIVKTADKYQLDFRLTTAIAQQESNLCK